jgi:uncharacterized cupin superfamily protein
VSDPNVIASASVAETRIAHGPCEVVRRQLGMPAGSRALGCSLVELAPGKRSWPLHFHVANEEAIFVLEGEGALRRPSGSVPIRAGDYVALPPGPAHAHQVVNDSSATLRYLCFSTMEKTDVVVYPESNKIGVFGGSAPGGDPSERVVAGFFKLDTQTHYFDGEP